MQTVMSTRRSLYPGASNVLRHLIGLLIWHQHRQQSSEDHIKDVLEASHALGTPLLRSTSLDDLERRLDELMESPHLHDTEVLVLEDMDSTLPPLVELDVDELAREFHELFGPGFRSEAQECAKLFIARASAIHKVLSPSLVGDINSKQDLLSEYDNFLDKIFNDITIHPVLRDAMLGAWRSDLCFLAIMHAKSYQPEPWLMRGLVNRFSEGMLAHTRLIASLPDVEIDEELIPMTMRYDLRSVDREMSSFCEMLDLAYEQASHSGHRVHAPFGEPLFDD